jgi:hypothetical protein
LGNTKCQNHNRCILVISKKGSGLPYGYPGLTRSRNVI